MKLVFIILLFYVSGAYGQTDSLKPNCILCGDLPSYLVRYGTVVHGSVTKIGETRFKVNINESMKGRKRNLFRRNLIIQFPDSSSVSQLKKVDYQLEIGREYVFILGRTRWKLHTLILRWPCNRFIVENDSLYISTEVLQMISLPEEVNIHQKNTFNDPRFASGYKVSVSDFREFCDVLNECFIRTRNRHVLKTEKVNDHFSDPLIEALVRHFEQMVPNKTK